MWMMAQVKEQLVVVAPQEEALLVVVVAPVQQALLMGVAR